MRREVKKGGIFNIDTTALILAEERRLCMYLVII